MSDTYKGGIDPIIKNVVPMAGSFKLSHTLPVNKIPEGTPALLTGRAIEIIASAKVYETAVATTLPKVYKDHSFYVGATFNGETITAIDQSNDDYDVFTVASMDVTLNEILYSNATTDNAVIVTSQTELNLSVSALAVVSLERMPNYFAAAIDSHSVVVMP